MSADNRFGVCLPIILRWEGGNDDNPHDPGGRTSRGIIQREYDAYRLRKNLPEQDVWLASDAEVNDIYEYQYWQPYCSIMPAGVDLVFFDTDVNCGPHEAALFLQRALGVTADGRIGMVTEAALKDTDPAKLITDYSNQRRAFYRSLHGFKYFGRGWLNRVNNIEAIALKMAEPGKTLP